MRRRANFKTYPELVDPDPERGYTVLDISTMRKGSASKNTQGATDKVKRIMAIPLTDEGAYIGRHEMGHAKWSPKIKPRSRTWLMRGCLEVCEEMRVNMGLALLGLPVVEPEDAVGVFCDNEVYDLLNGQVVQVILRAVAHKGTNGGVELEELLEHNATERKDENAIWVLSLLRQLDKRMARGRKQKVVPTFKYLHKIARWLEKEIRKVVKTEKKPDTQARKALAALGVGFGRSIGLKKHHEPGQLPSVSGFRSYWGGGTGTNFYDPKMSRFYGAQWGQTPPGEMHVLTPPLTLSIVPPELEKTPRSRSSEEGVEFRYIERWVSDQRVFKRRSKKRKGGGTVLIDTSGSMCLDDNDVDKIVAGAPEATKIATYSGAGDEGWLQVVVDKGMKYKGRLATRGGSNVIDLPALEWLSMQPEPRVWLSDGGVTGVNDSPNRAINEACNTIMADNGIMRCENVERVVKVLKRDEDMHHCYSSSLDEDDY